MIFSQQSGVKRYLVRPAKSSYYLRRQRGKSRAEEVAAGNEREGIRNERFRAELAEFRTKTSISLQSVSSL